MKTKDIEPISVFGWPGPMTSMEKQICEMSIKFDPLGKTVLQAAQPLKDEISKDKKTIANIRIHVGRGSSEKKYGFWLMAPRVVEHWYADDMLKEGFNKKIADEEYVEKVVTFVEEWMGSNKPLLIAHTKVETDTLEFKRLQLYISTLGRQHGRVKGKVRRAYDRRITAEQQERDADEATLEEDLRGRGEELPEDGEDPGGLQAPGEEEGSD